MIIFMFTHIKLSDVFCSDGDNSADCGPYLTLDDQAVPGSGHWHSQKDYAWLQVDFGASVHVVSVLVHFRFDGSWQERWTNIEVRNSQWLQCILLYSIKGC